MTTLQILFKATFVPLALMAPVAMWLLWVNVTAPMIRRDGFWSSLLPASMALGATGVAWEIVLYGLVRWSPEAAPLGMNFALTLPPKLAYIVWMVGVLSSASHLDGRPRRTCLVAAVVLTLFFGAVALQM